MDPDCAICSQPALVRCECESKGLDTAVRQAEQRMMASVFTEIRTWVRGHAQDYILSFFSTLTTRRKEVHNSHIHRITDRAYHYYNAPPHPSEIAAADAELKRGIDEDWRASVQRYPEVLEYFYGLVELSLPGEEESCVRDPPLSALGGGRGKVRLREARDGGGERRRRRGISAGREGNERIRDGRRPGVAFAPVPGYGYVQPPGH
ncbi:hypothetical protein D0Z07_4551 [Hyphodiscus hymeniophilus]|uniref:Uncharacterized protein n=1 Tax=Hyphodiscus hymeniophilus TaxID=353542 RepID=A0A9P6VK06_9HELO|nr:hypothetical protein D0Z07_4551 [Hyphodiscus hymeniophilus]